jgi:two-component system cell cycle sensor histidine kinase/response regulator CckA
VTDTGCGISAEELARIFDPFYSTKFIGRGLGLAVVQGILGSIGGGIRVRSTPGVGSTFEVLLPCAAQNSAGVVSRGGDGNGVNTKMLLTAPA